MLFNKNTGNTLLPLLFKSNFLLNFRDNLTAINYYEHYSITSHSLIIRVEVASVIFQLCTLIGMIVSQLVTKESFDFLRVYTFLTGHIIIIGLWMVLCYKVKRIRGYAGTFPIIAWLIVLAEIMVYTRTQWILTPSLLPVYVGCIAYGIFLCDSWIKSTLSFVLGSFYFLTRTLLSLKIYLDSVTMITVGVMLFVAIETMGLYYFEKMKKIDYLAIYDDQEVIKFASFFIEQLPIGIVISHEKSIWFANKEFGTMFNLSLKFPLYRCNDDQNKLIFETLNQLRSLTATNDSSRINFDQTIYYKYEGKYIKIIEKNIFYGCNECSIICFYDLTQLRKLENEKIAKKYQMMLMATMSHELRTPLNGIIGTIKMIQDRVDPVIKTEIITIENCGILLLMKINDMLVHT